MIELRPAKYLLGRLAPMDNNDKIPQFNLGAGTYNSTVYLRGDGVWANPLAGAGFVPLTRELTINGVTYDLSVNRTWTIDTTSATWGNITGTLSNQTDLQNALDAKQPTILPGLVTQYWRGDKSWQPLNRAAVGLGNVDNTSDLNKPISTATQTALNAKENTANKGIPGGYASLAGDGKVPSDQLPSYVDDVIEVANYAALPTVGQTGVIYITLDNNNVYRWAGSVYVQISQPNAVWGSITGTLSSQTDLQNALNAKQDDITLTTTGTSGAATFIGNTLNIPQYSGALIGYVPYTGATTNVNLGEYGLSAGWVQIDTSPTTYTPGVGKLGWNNSDGTLEFQLLGGNVTLQIGQEQVARVVNKTDPSIDLLESNYQVVKVGGAQGNRLKVALAQANNDANSAETLGIVTEDIPKNQEGFITTSGIVRNINTTGSLQGETWLDGDMLFLSGTVAGQITKVKPSAPIHTVILGYVIRAHATQGQIYVKVDNGYELGELHDVNTTISKTTPVDTDSVLLQDTADSNIWKKLSWLNTKATLKTYFDTLYQAAGSYVPSSRTLTVNGTTYDLSANRSWTIDKASVGLGNVDNTSDLNKPISTATQTALNAKQDDITLTTTGTSGAATLVGATLNIPQYQSVITNPITGTGTLNYVAKFTPGSSSIGDSIIFDNGTNVGIGTSNPQRKLDVVGSHTTSTFRVYYPDENVAGQDSSVDIWASEPGQTYTGSGIGSNVNGHPYYGRRNNALGQSFIRFYDSSMMFHTSSSNAVYDERMRITAGGNVGIGTTSPGAKLDVFDPSSSSTSPTIALKQGTSGSYANIAGAGDMFHGIIMRGIPANSNDYSVTAGDFMSFYEYGGEFIFYKKQPGVLTPQMIIKSSGNVGIGTTSPDSRLHINGNIKVGNALDNSSQWIGKSSTGNENFRGAIKFASTTTDDIIQFNTHRSGVSSDIRMTIDGIGNVGIGTTNPDAYPFSAKLSVAGNISVTGTKIGWGITDAFTLNGIDTAHYGLSSNFNLVQLSGYGGVVFATTGTERMRITGGGNVGIGTTNPSEKLTVNGNIYASQGGLIAYRTDGGTGLDVNGGDLGSGSYIARFKNYSNVDKVVIKGNGNVGVSGEISSNYGSNRGTLWLGDVVQQEASFTSFGVLDYVLHHGSGYSNIMRVQGNGRVGIGTTSPATTLELKRTEYVALTLNDTYVTTEILNTGGRFVINTPSQMRFDILSTPRVYVDAVSMGVNTASPFPSAALQVDSQTQGFLPPRMSDLEMNAISGPEAGLIVWNTDAGLFYGFDGSNWRKIQFV